MNERLRADTAPVAIAPAAGVVPLTAEEWREAILSTVERDDELDA